MDDPNRRLINGVRRQRGINLPRQRTAAVSTCSSVHSRHLPITVSLQIAKLFLGSRYPSVPSLINFSYGFPAHFTSFVWACLKNTMKSLPPTERGTKSRPAIMANPGLYRRSGKSSLISWEVITEVILRRRKYSSMASASCECSILPNIFVSPRIDSSPKSASKSFKRSSEDAMMYPDGFASVGTVLMSFRASSREA